MKVLSEWQAVEHFKICLCELGWQLINEQIYTCFLIFKLNYFLCFISW